MNIRRVGAELLHAGGRTGVHDEGNGRFRNFFAYLLDMGQSC